MTHNYRPLQPLNDRTVYSSLTLKETKTRDEEPVSAVPFVDKLAGGATMQKSVGVGVIAMLFSLSFFAAV